MQLSLLLIALTSMVALAVAYPMSGEMMGQSSVAKREAEALGVYEAPVSYDQKIRAEEEAAGVYFPISYEDKKRAEEEEAYAAFCCYDDKSPNKRSEDA